jgi:hypothetical protein
LPAAVVGGEVEVVQLRGEIGFAQAPVHQQVLHQERGGDHPQAVVHVAREVELAHARIDERVAGAPLAPGRKQPFVVGPGDALELRAEGAGGDARVMPEDLEVEIAPGELGEPCLGPVPGMRAREAGQLANGDRAEAVVHREVGDAPRARKIACAGVVADP